MKNKKNLLIHRTSVAAFATVVFAMSSPAYASTTWDGGIAGPPATSPTWGTAVNWSDNLAPTFNDATALSFPTSAVVNFNTVLGNPRTIRSMTFGANVSNDFGVSFTGSVAGTAQILTMGGGAGAPSISVDALAAGNITIGNPYNLVSPATIGSLALAGNLDVVHNGSGLLNFNRAITGVGFGITKTGTGTMMLNSVGASPNTFTGNVNINQGRLIANGFVVGTDINTAANVNLGGGDLEVRNISGANKDYNLVDLNVTSASTLAYQNTGATNFSLTFSGANAFALDANLTVQNISPTTTLANVINISRNITGLGGMIVESYNNINSGTTNFGLGRVQLGGDNNAWTGALDIRKGTAEIYGAGAQIILYTGDIILGDTGNAFGAGLLLQPNADTSMAFANDITVRSGGFRTIRSSNGQFTAGADTNYTFGGNIALEGDLNLHISADVADRRITVNGDISGVGGLSLTKGENGFIRFTGNNSYLGATAIGAGTSLNILSATGTAIGDSSAVTFAGVGSVLQFNSTNETVGSIASSGTDGDINLGANTLTTGGNNASTSYGGAISGSSTSGLTKVGSGTFTLTGNNTPFTGAINVGAGTLVAGRAGSADIGFTSAVNLNGGNLVFQPDTGFDKIYNGTINVNNAGILSYDNTNNTTHTLTLGGTSPLALNASLTVKNTSDNETLVNAINISRDITGTGDVIVETYNDIAASADSFSLGRVLLSGDNSGWSGNLVISEGTVSLSGSTANTTGTGTIVIGGTGNAFGAGLAFNTDTTLTYTNAITVNSGGFRAIRGNNFNSSNITFSGPVALNGGLTVDHSREITDRKIDFSGTVSGAGGLTITRVEGNAGSTALLSGSGKTYIGDTTVTNGASLSVTTSLTSDIVVQTGGRFGGNGGSTNQDLTMAAGSTFFFFYPTFAPFNVTGVVTLDATFGVDDLVGGSQGEVVPWATIPAGAYTLITTATNTFGGIQNLGAGNAATGLAGGRSAYFQYAGGGLQLVVTVSASGYDAWKLANTTSGGLGDDHDGDGVDNGTEYFLFGSGPSTGFTALPGVVNNSVTWIKAATGYAGVYNTDFFVETSDTLATGSWVTASTNPADNIPNTVYLNGNNVKYTFPTTGPKKFARLKVTGPN